MRGLGRLFAATLVCLAAWSAPGFAAEWQQQAQIQGERFRPNLPLLGISCPSASSCVAVGELDTIVSTANPTGGDSAWDVAKPMGAAETDCHPTNTPPCKPPESRVIRAVSCPSAGLCVAVTGEGYVYSSTNPTGSGDAWRVADIDGPGRDTHLLSVSCPTASLCVAVSGERFTSGKVLTTTDPTGPASAWTVTQLDESLDLRGVSCGTPTLCVAVAEQGRMLVSTNPTGGPSAWREVGTPGGPGDLQGVSCAATVLCVAGNASGNLLTSTSPGVGSSWSEADGGGAPVQITAVSCLPSRQCVAVDNNGDVVTSTDPTGGGSWSRIKLIPYAQPPGQTEEPLNGLFGVSCASTSFCALVAADGQIFTSTDPFAAPSNPSTGGAKKMVRRPKVTIAKLILPNLRQLERGHAHAVARFFADGPVRRYECELPDRRFRPCRSPKRFRVGKKGTFAIHVRAVGKTGLRGPAAVKRFWVGKKCLRGSCFSPDGELPLLSPHH